MVWLKYETVDEGEIISRKVAPYSYRTRDTKVRGRSTYFYGEDFTPGEDHTIKCFLIENCLDAKESKQSFTPRHPVEIKMEIDKLEQKRKEDELKKQKDGDNEQPTTPDKDRKDNDEIVNDEPSEPKPEKKVEPTKKPQPKVEPKKPEQPKVEPKPEKKPEKKPEPKDAYNKPEQKKSDKEKE